MVVLEPVGYHIAVIGETVLLVVPLLSVDQHVAIHIEQIPFVIDVLPATAGVGAVGLQIPPAGIVLLPIRLLGLGGITGGIRDSR